jgi:hypothetical protein
MRTCKHCGIDLATVPATDAVTRHIVGLCAPVRVDPDFVIAALEIEDEREKQAIRRQCQREALRRYYEWRYRPVREVDVRLALKIFIGLFLIGAAVIFAASYWQAP